MERKVALVALVIALVLSVSACAVSSKRIGVGASCDELSKERTITRDVEVVVGDSLTVTLCSNPSTGFQWESAQVSDEGILQQTGSGYATLEASRPGAGGTMEWTFKALKQGEATVSMDYSRPWQGGEKGVWRFVLNVAIK